MYELPNIPETYVHRIGRTGRAGASGVAISFCDSEEKTYLRDIQNLINKNIPVVQDHAFLVSPGPLQQQLPIQKKLYRAGHKSQTEAFQV
jgi:ATP-dependent RNA helicase RhlE